jgi:hypothetical protein
VVREDRPAVEGERCPEPSARLRRVESSTCHHHLKIAPDQCVRGRGLILSHAVARGAEWAWAAGYARYVPKMITGSCAAVVAWAGRIGADWPTRSAQLTPAGDGGQRRRDHGRGHAPNRKPSPVAAPSEPGARSSGAPGSSRLLSGTQEPVTALSEECVSLNNLPV